MRRSVVEDKMECNITQNIKGCPCTYPGCPRKGKCCECIKHHLRDNELPACCFPKDVEKTFNRSIAKFIEVNK